MKNLAHLPFLLFMVFFFASCNAQEESSSNSKEYIEPEELSEKQMESLEKATFAGGCFWCTEAVFERVEGVVKVVSGYSGGKEETADYGKVSRGQTEHAETIQIYYDSEKVSYETLVDIFLGSHDPTQLNRQGPDVGPQYRSAIFYRTDEEKEIAQDKIEEFERKKIYNDDIVTKLTSYDAFYPAEDYHQDYYRLNPDNSYIWNVSKPKVDKFMKNYKDLLKPEYQ